MRIEILDGAEKDLLEGFEFYEGQSDGLGSYFLDSILSDIESLNILPEYILHISDITDYWRSDFHLLFTINIKTR